MNNYCRNCGENLTNSSVCEKCGTKVLENRVGELDRLLAKKYIMIFFIIFMLYFIIYITAYMFPYARVLPYSLWPIINFLPIALIIFVIYAKKKLKYSKFFNVVFWMIVLLIVLFILFILYAIISCEYKF